MFGLLFFFCLFCLVLFAVFAHFDDEDDEDDNEGEDEGDDMDLGSFVYLLYFFLSLIDFVIPSCFLAH